MKKASPYSKPAPDKDHCTTTTSKGRRAVTSLWYAIRTINGALLTADDLALIREALTEIRSAIEVQS
jgi:queuine/archaeosine tRNA-ribosyltransferase